MVVQESERGKRALFFAGTITKYRRCQRASIEQRFALAAWPINMRALECRRRCLAAAVAAAVTHRTCTQSDQCAFVGTTEP